MRPRSPRWCGRRAWRSVVLLTLALSGQFAVAEAGAQRAARLQSRAQFAALDSAALADSAAMAPLNAHDRLDSLMLDMFVELERGSATFGMSPSRIRRWDGFGSQAHPRLGLMIDRQEIDTFLAGVRRLKGQVGVPEDEILRRQEWAVRFLVAHEHAHLLQYRVLGRDSVEAPDAAREIECGADILGGYRYMTHLGARSSRERLPSAALDAARDFGYVIGSPDWLDGRSHPMPEDRRACINRGMIAATGMDALALARRGLVDSLSDPRIKTLTADDPDFRFGRISVVDLSRRWARKLTAGTIAAPSARFAVERSDSLEFVLGSLASAASRGSAEMRLLRGPVAPSGRDQFVLRPSMPSPWRCVTGAREGREEADCSYTSRTRRESADSTYAELVKRARARLEADGWREAKSRADAGGALSARARELLRTYFTREGADPDDPLVSRVVLYLGKGGESTAQLPPGFDIGFEARSAAAKP